MLILLRNSISPQIKVGQYMCVAHHLEITFHRVHPHPVSHFCNFYFEKPEVATYASCHQLAHPDASAVAVGPRV